MTLKVILPITGIFGSITSAFLASYGSHSGDHASNFPLHKQNNQPIKSIEIPFSCRSLDYRDVRNRSNYVFTVIVDIQDWKDGKLKGLDPAAVGNARFELSTDGSWGYADSLIKGQERLSLGVYKMKIGKGIRVEINNQKYIDYKSTEFACSESVAGFTITDSLHGDGQSEDTIFFSRMVKSGDKKLVSLNEGMEQVKIDYDSSSCKAERAGDKKSTICDLKLSDMAGSKWNAKLLEVAKFKHS